MALLRPGHIVAFALCAVSMGCVVTRTSRPLIRGTVVDEETEQPLGGVEIWTGNEVETRSAPDGAFELSRRTYREVTFPGREAPPVIVNFRAVKEGYCTYRYSGKNMHGGGATSSVWTVDVKLSPVRPDCDTSTTFLPSMDTPAVGDDE